MNRRPAKDRSRKSGAFVAISMLVMVSLASCGSSSSSGASGSTGAPPSTAAASTATPPSSAEATTTAPTTAPPTTIDPAAIRAVDFLSFTYPAGACDPKDPRGPFVMANGKPLLGEPAPGADVPTFPISVDEVVYGDVTGDGVDEAVVRLVCNKGGTATWAVADVFTPAADAPRRIGVLTAQTSGPDVNISKIGSIQVVNGAIVVEELVAVGEDPTCCPSQTRLVSWNYKDGQMTTAAAGTPPAAQGLDPKRLSTDGVGELRFGDPLSKAEKLTGKRAKVDCGVGSSPADVAQAGGVIDDALPGLTLVFKPGGVFSEYWVTNRDYTTASGAHVGMSAAEVQAAIPYAVRETGPQGSDVLAVRSEGNVLYFVINGSSVTQITAGKDGEAGFGC